MLGQPAADWARAADTGMEITVPIYDPGITCGTEYDFMFKFFILNVKHCENKCNFVGFFNLILSDLLKPKS